MIGKIRAQINKLEEADMQEMLNVQRIYLPDADKAILAAGRRRPGAGKQCVQRLAPAPGSFCYRGTATTPGAASADSLPRAGRRLLAWSVARWVLLFLGWTMVIGSLLAGCFLAVDAGWYP
jgi:hypothetical protein